MIENSPLQAMQSQMSKLFGSPASEAGQHPQNPLEAFGVPAAPQGDQTSGASGADAVELSPQASSQFLYARAQFEVNIQSLRAISNENGTQIQERSFSFSASFEFLQAASGEEPIDPANLQGTDLLDTLKDLFSPEKTAGRILDFALSGFTPQQGEGAKAAREEYAERIGAAVQKGFDEAQAILGNLEEEIQDGIDQTHELVFDGFDRFVDEGLPEDHAERSDRIRQYAQQWQASARLSYSSMQMSTYRANGQVADANRDPSQVFQREA
jgi:hypothetical protein